MSKRNNLKDFNRFLDDYAESVYEEAKDMVKKYTNLIADETAKRAPVDTGNLKRSIKPEIFFSKNELTGYVGTVMDYAIYTEFGTRYIPAHEYFLRSYDKYYESLIKELESKGFKKK